MDPLLQFEIVADKQSMAQMMLQAASAKMLEAGATWLRCTNIEMRDDDRWRLILEGWAQRPDPEPRRPVVPEMR